MFVNEPNEVWLTEIEIAGGVGGKRPERGWPVESSGSGGSEE